MLIQIYSEKRYNDLKVLIILLSHFKSNFSEKKIFTKRSALLCVPKAASVACYQGISHFFAKLSPLVIIVIN